MRLLIGLLIVGAVMTTMSVVGAEAQVQTCVWPNPCVAQ